MFNFYFCYFLHQFRMNKATFRREGWQLHLLDKNKRMKGQRIRKSPFEKGKQNRGTQKAFALPGAQVGHTSGDQATALGSRAPCFQQSVSKMHLKTGESGYQPRSQYLSYICTNYPLRMNYYPHLIHRISKKFEISNFKHQKDTVLD